MARAIAKLRVTSLKVVPFQYATSTIMGEVVELRASGNWADNTGQTYPASLHITLPPGHPSISGLGDEIPVTVER